MGIDYYLVNHETKEMIELGRGGWWNFWDEDLLPLLYKESLDQYIREKLLNNKELNNEETDYWARVSKMIWCFVENANPDKLEIIMDCSSRFYDIADDYKTVNSIHLIWK